ncbi:cell division protein FtsQ/DivIB [Synechococcus sp. PCC 6312]|uniref:cell division protein FtsQ/DivIB n=1 Tax=Synechococcus sp. (strain ATCC 27167 / PCC 6312) TaxID=195253 RepID=UPI00029F44F4|nr:FtsQ-type POTRA domain-containing protein [Synechococcus sp. PCC 6312]AFY62498.1 cell division septal protein [Synechococcus sp. PCC 6312]
MPSSKVTAIDSIQQRRKQLKNQKRLRSLANIWRTGVLMGLTGSLAWGLTLPDWMIHQPSQVTIIGHKLLKTEAIQALLPVRYPQSLLRLNPQGIIQGLEATLPVQRVTIARHLFPPTLIVGIDERLPVAMVLCERCRIKSPANLEQGPASIWMLDAQGLVAPRTSYVNDQLQSPASYPKLRGYFVPSQAGSRSIMEIDPQRQKEWQTLFPLVAGLDMDVKEIDWQNPRNIILQTRFGPVHLGAYSPRLPAQLAALKRLEQLPQYLNPQQLVYIDLVNPDEPLLQMKTTVVRPNQSKPNQARNSPPTPSSPSPTPSFATPIPLRSP